MDALPNFMYQRFVAALRAMDEPVARDTYALSFYLEFNLDAYTDFVVGLSYNTASHWRQQAVHAASEAEAKWHFAFWPQAYIAAVGSCEFSCNSAADGATVTRFLSDMLLHVSEADAKRIYEEEQFESTTYRRLMARDEYIVTTAAGVARRLHDEGVIGDIFGRPIPILVHDLAYGPAVRDWTLAASPPGLVEEFEKFHFPGGPK